MIIQLETQCQNYILVIFENLSLDTNLTGDTYFFFKKALIAIEQINLLKGASKKIKSLHCKAKVRRCNGNLPVGNGVSQK